MLYLLSAITNDAVMAFDNIEANHFCFNAKLIYISSILCRLNVRLTYYLMHSGFEMVKFEIVFLVLCLLLML